jgi:2-amino-4-hydroxy-6-hydroxymethyldihydropteridine diphosphokinase
MMAPCEKRPQAFVALGANLGDPIAQIRAALMTLAKTPGLRLLRVSSLYRTAPVGVHGQPDFINAVAALETALTPQALLAALLDIETQSGRRRDFYHAPRVLDLDLLLYDSQTINTPELRLPHPRMHLRAFVLTPLLEIAPDCHIPGRGNAAAWQVAVQTQGVERLSPGQDGG